MAGNMSIWDAFGLTGRFLSLLDGSSGTYRKIAELKHSNKSRLIAIITAARVESSPHANVAILDISTFGSGNTVYAKLHSLLGSKIVEAYYIKDGDTVSLYVSAYIDYARISVVPLLQQSVTFTSNSPEPIGSTATRIEYSE